MKATEQNIQPFPETINMDMFGSYISGFVDGEGCFSLGVDRNRGYAKQTPICRFSIQIRADDIAVLKLMQSYFQCGVVFSRSSNQRGNHNPITSFVVCRIEYLSKIIVPHFEKYPLFAKKKRDFEIWKKAVALAYSVNKRKRTRIDLSSRSVRKWTESEREEYRGLRELLQEVRKFGSTETVVISEKKTKEEIFLFDEAM